MQRDTFTRATFLMGVILIFIGLALFRPLSLRSDWSMDIRDKLHWVGITALAMVSLATIITIRNIRHKITTTWLNTHCISTGVATILALIHSRTRADVILPIHYHSYLTLILMILLSISGLITRTTPRSESVRKYWRVYHMPLSIAFFLTLTYHILVKLAVI